MSQYKDAISWCLLGAIIKCYAGPECDCSVPEFQIVCNKVTNRIQQSIMGWNDDPDRKHSEVLALCEELDI